MSSKKFHFLFLRNIIAYSFNNKVGKEEKYIFPLSEIFKMAPWTPGASYRQKCKSKDMSCLLRVCLRVLCVWWQWGLVHFSRATLPCRIAHNMVFQPAACPRCRYHITLLVLIQIPECTERDLSTAAVACCRGGRSGYIQSNRLKHGRLSFRKAISRGC
jgi:hypothetical protein